VQGQRNRRKGCPRQAADRPAVVSGAALVQVTPRLSCVGVHLFRHGLDHQETLGPVVAHLPQAREAHKRAHPDDDFPLLPHREQPLLRRFAALLCAPLFGLDPLTACETHAHPLPTLLGRGYHRSTLSPFLGHRERIEAAAARMPVLAPHPAGQIAYGDGHRMAYWSRVPMPKGTSTMLGRIMAGSPAVIAHDAAGQALLVASDPPDLPLSQIIVDDCQKWAGATGSPLLVIDRAVHAVALARAFDAQGLGVLCMLDDNEPQGLERFEAPQVDTLQEGRRVDGGPWKTPRPPDPRHIGIVEPAEGKTLGYWATPKVEAVLAATAWPRVDRERTARQEHSCKRMMDHGALHTNDGRKKLVGPDRHQQRARDQLLQSRETAQQRVDKQGEEVKATQDQGAESESKGHGQRLAQRQRALAGVEKALKNAKHKQDHLAEQAYALGPPGERADRDVRQQTIMTVRTLFPEKALHACMVVLVGTLQTKVS
jgi:hypothetical protein